MSEPMVTKMCMSDYVVISIQMQSSITTGSLQVPHSVCSRLVLGSSNSLQPRPLRRFRRSIHQNASFYSGSGLTVKPVHTRREITTQIANTKGHKNLHTSDIWGQSWDPVLNFVSGLPLLFIKSNMDNGSHSPRIVWFGWKGDRLYFFNLQAVISHVGSIYLLEICLLLDFERHKWTIPHVRNRK